MANKKCPKCGEDNPAEAVMCWACYTPLTAGAGAAMGAGAGGRAGATTMTPPGGLPGAGMGGMSAGEGEKKKIDPKLFFVGGALAVAGIIFALTSMGGSGGGGGGEEPAGGNPLKPGGGPGMGPGPGPGPGPSAPGPVSQPSITNPTGVTDPPVAPSLAPYTMVVPPSPRYDTATLGITSNSPLSSDNEAVGLAKTARQNLQRSGKWANTQIVVFSDSNTSATFARYMSARRGAPLTAANYAELANQGAWTGATAFYESRGNREVYRYPSRNPQSWWNSGR